VQDSSPALAGWLCLQGRSMACHAASSLNTVERLVLPVQTVQLRWCLPGQHNAVHLLPVPPWHQRSHC
jgi:hypothetical protein